MIGPRARGIDVSRHRPVLDWDKVIASGITFIGVKATEGNSVTDPTLIAHRDGIRANPFTLAIYYHFARSGPPVAQAQRFMKTVGPLQQNERLCLDIEVLPDPLDTITWVESFFAELVGMDPKRRPLIYTSNRIWTQFGPAAWKPATKIDLWAPRYNVTQSPVVPAPWPRWTFWQWTDGGDTGPTYNCPGVGPCDANYFNGTEGELRAYALAGSGPVRS